MTLVIVLLTWFMINISNSQSVFGGSSSRLINVYEQPFKIYWNAPTFQCSSKKVRFENLLKKYDIIVNYNDSFKGEHMTIMYDPGSFPGLFKSYDRGVLVRNGGVPQAGNLTEHLEMFKQNVLSDFPDVNYSGLAVIDFETWRPIFRQNWGSIRVYRELSLEIERELHPTWSMHKLFRTAESRFEEAGRKYVEQTIALGKSMRPNATWGYYAYPYCYNMQGSPLLRDCSETVMAENDRLQWMFQASDSFHPSLYLSEFLSSEQRKHLMEGRIYEAVRIKGGIDSAIPKLVYPYIWYVYRDTLNFLSEDDIMTALRLFKIYGIDGIIIWGSSNDVNTKTKCELLFEYVDKVLGPTLLKFNNL